MRLRYIGEHASTETFGRTFYQYKWVNADGMDALARETLANNPQFEADGGADAEPEPESLEPAVEEG
jgi:hypothetical protein